jgi:hypothetical protein
MANGILVGQVTYTDGRGSIQPVARFHKSLAYKGKHRPLHCV